MCLSLLPTFGDARQSVLYVIDRSKMTYVNCVNFGIMRLMADFGESGMDEI
jgi:uncharacterized membrane protein